MLEQPQVWELARWLGIEQPLSLHGFLLACHDLWTPTYIATFDAGAADDAGAEDDGPPGLVEDYWEGIAGADAAEFGEGVLEDPIKEATKEEKQKTYRKNAGRWLETKPLPRLFALSAIIRTQQRMQKDLIARSGFDYWKKEVARRCAGAKPSFKIVDMAAGRCTSSAVLEFANLACDSQRWASLPTEAYSHEITEKAYRSCAAAAAATYQLLEKQFKAVFLYTTFADAHAFK